MVLNRELTGRVVFIGAGGEMCRIAVEAFVSATKAPLVLCDINDATLQALVSKLPSGRATSHKLDLFNPGDLREAIAGASLVVLGAGPYSRTSAPVLAACLEAKVPYLDFDDDVESTQEALSLAQQAQEAGIACYIGCGASPGMSNVMVMDATRDLDTVDTIDVCWLVGDERGHAGKAVLEHLMHIAAGPCLTWKDGKATMNETWVETAHAPIIPGFAGETLLHETAHPEPVTLPRLFPKANRIRCLGGLDPAPYNGIARGLGKAVRSQALTLDQATGWLFELLNSTPSLSSLGSSWGELQTHLRGGEISLNELYSLLGHASAAVSPLRFALWGMLEQIWTGECTVYEVVRAIVDSARGKQAPYRSGLLVRAVGMRHGHPAVSIRRTPETGPDSFLGKSMGAVTGYSCAAFMLMAIDDGKKRSGIFCPEDWAAPEKFYSALERLGCPREKIVESL